MRLWGWRVARAPAAAVGCFRCELPFDPDELSVSGVIAEVQPFDLSLDGERIDDVPASASMGHYHLRCAVDVDIDQAVACFRAARDPSGPIRASFAIALARSAVRRSLLLARNGGRGPRVAPPAIEPAIDPFGRPRVRVLMVGSATTSLSWTWDALQQRTRDGTLRSPRREYVLRGFSFLTAEELHRDPSQPVGATVFAAILGVKVVRAQRDKLASLRASGLPTPVLWVLGRPEGPAELDRAVTALRAELDRAGFAGDDAAVCSAEFLDEDALHALALALDEVVAVAKTPRTFEDAVEQALGALEQALRDRESERLASGMTALAEVLFPAQRWTKSAAERARTELTPLVLGRIRSAATACFCVSTCRRPAISVLAAVGVSESAFAHALEATLGESPRSLPEGFLSAWELLLEADALLAWNLLARAFAHGPKPRRDALRAAWARCAVAPIAAALRAQVSAMKGRDPRRADALARADEIEARCASEPVRPTP
jgi:hypothetical protein